MAQSRTDTDKKRVFSVTQIEERPHRPSDQLKLVLSNDEAAELVRRISTSESDNQAKIFTHIKIEDDITLQRRRSSFMQAFKNQSLYNKAAGTPNEDTQNLICLAEDAQNGRTNPLENNTLYTKRLVEKNGSCNVIPRSSKKYGFINDFYTTLTDLKWRYCLLISITANVSTWTFFAMLYYVIISVNQDVENYENMNWNSCILNVNSFITCFLFSIETQHTIGYGFRAMKERCSSAIVVWKIQSCAGILINSLFCGLIFAKLMSPQYRSKLIRFSRKAVISINNGVPCFIFRVIDFQKSNLVNCHVRAVLIRDHMTKEEEFIPFYNRSLSLKIEETTGSNLFVAWPVNVIHVIDNQSPLFGLTPRELQEEYLEVIVIFEGVVENSGKLMQVRTSYIAKEILWGASFSPLLNFNCKTGKYEMDYSNFENIQITLPLPYVTQSKRYLRRNSSSGVSSPESLKDEDPLLQLRLKLSTRKNISRKFKNNQIRS